MTKIKVFISSFKIIIIIKKIKYFAEITITKKIKKTQKIRMLLKEYSKKFAKRRIFFLFYY